jgi:hypothetical protein
MFKFRQFGTRNLDIFSHLGLFPCLGLPFGHGELPNPVRVSMSPLV